MFGRSRVYLGAAGEQKRRKVNACLSIFLAWHRRSARAPVSLPILRPLGISRVAASKKKTKKTPHLARWLAAPSGRGRGSPSGPQSVPALPACRCLMSAYEQTFDCQVAVPPRHADQPEFCHCCSNPGASKGGLGFPK